MKLLCHNYLLPGKARHAVIAFGLSRCQIAPVLAHCTNRTVSLRALHLPSANPKQSSFIKGWSSNV